MAVRYAFLSLASGKAEYGECEMGSLETLLERNEEDPVDAFERQRTSRMYEYQGEPQSLHRPPGASRCHLRPGYRDRLISIRKCFPF